MTTLLITPQSPITGNLELVACVADGDRRVLTSARQRYDAIAGDHVDYVVIANLILTDAPLPDDEVVVSRHRGAYRCPEYPYDSRGKRYLYAVRRHLKATP